jgi:hypothetical protein
MVSSKRIVSDPSQKPVPSVSGTAVLMHWPFSHVPFLLPRSSIETSRPVADRRAFSSSLRYSGNHLSGRTGCARSRTIAAGTGENLNEFEPVKGEYLDFDEVVERFD